MANSYILGGGSIIKFEWTKVGQMTHAHSVIYVLLSDIITQLTQITAQCACHHFGIILDIMYHLGMHKMYFSACF